MEFNTHKCSEWKDKKCDSKERFHIKDISNFIELEGYWPLRNNGR